MLLLAAKTILIAIAAFFLLLGSASLIAPDRARRFLLGFAATAARHYTELALRFVAGGAMLLFASHSIHHVALTAFGWVLIATTAIMTLVPWRVHRRFAEVAVPRALHFLSVVGIVSLVLGSFLFWVLVSATVAQEPVQNRREQCDLRAARSAESGVCVEVHEHFERRTARKHRAQ